MMSVNRAFSILILIILTAAMIAILVGCGGGGNEPDDDPAFESCIIDGIAGKCPKITCQKEKGC